MQHNNTNYTQSFASISFITLLLITLFTSLSLQSFAQTKKPPIFEIEHFTKLPGAREVKISPDGKHISVIFKRDGEDMLGILRLADMKATAIIKAFGHNYQIGKIHWANNERVLYSIYENRTWDKEQFENGELFGVNINGKRHRALMGYRASGKTTSKGRYGHHRIIDLLPDEKNQVLVSFYPWRAGLRYWHQSDEAKPVIYKLNIKNGHANHVDNLPTPLATAIADNNNHVRFSVGEDKQNSPVIHYKATSDADWSKIDFNHLKATNITPPSFSRDNQSVYLTGYHQDKTQALYRYHLTDKSLTKLYQHSAADISNILYGFDQTSIVALATDLGKIDYHYLNDSSEMAKLHKRLIDSFENSDAIITSVSEDKSRAIVYVYSDKDSGHFFLYDKAQDDVDYLISSRQWIDPVHMAATQAVEFKARDGLTLHGYLTLPQGQEKSLPIVVLPHGGPHGVRDTWGFDWEVQLLANRGYGVLQVNFRGSDGFGAEFKRSGYGQWGAAMQDDITDATLALIEQGIADKDRICSYGASFGGYAALMGAVKTPDLYRCAIGSMGVYNLPMTFEEGDIADTTRGLNYLKLVLGDDQNKLKQLSPAYNTEKIKAQVLLIHGTQDKRAPLEQVQSLMTAMDKNNKPYQFLLLKDEGHGYYDEDNRITVYKKLLAFLDKHIGQQAKSE